MISPAEYLELLSISSANTGQFSVATTSVLFAYIVAAYLVGAKLTKFQAIAISCLYSIYFTFPVLATIGEQRRIENLGRRFQEEYPIEFQHYYSEGSAAEYLMYGGLVISLIAWALSIYFMYDCRRQKELE